jgi:hypothetical protein
MAAGGLLKPTSRMRTVFKCVLVYNLAAQLALSLSLITPNKLIDWLNVKGRQSCNGFVRRVYLCGHWVGCEKKGD